MPRRQTCRIQREPCLSCHRSTERFSTSQQNSRTLCAQTQRFAEFFKVFGFELVTGKKCLDVVGCEVRFLQGKLGRARQRSIGRWATCDITQSKHVVVLRQLQRWSNFDQTARRLLDVQLFDQRPHLYASEPDNRRGL